MKKIFHFYSLTPEWQDKLAEQTETKVIHNKIIVFPEKIGKGHSYFTQVTPGISVLFIDLTLNVPLKICREKSANELFIFHFDLSEHVNLIKINNHDYEIGSYDKLDLAIIDNQIESSYKPAVHERTFALRILVDKNLLNGFISKFHDQITKNISEIKSDKKQDFYHYGNIDSNSTLLLQSFKTKSIYDFSFEPFIKGATLKLLGNFFNKFYEVENTSTLTQVESEAINKTINYLLSNLYSPFPSVIFLAAMAGMSESKYKTVFKKCFETTPNQFFIKEKMNLAKQLLQSGNFRSLTEIIHELNYSKLNFFSSKYLEINHKKPSEDFIKKK